MGQLTRAVGVSVYLLPLFCAIGCARTVLVWVTPQRAVVASGQTVRFQATVVGDGDGVTWSVKNASGGNTDIGTIDGEGRYVSPAGFSGVVIVTAASRHDPTNMAIASAIVIPPGEVTTTNHPQVALYRISPPAEASVFVQFGADTDYGLTTAAHRTPLGGGPTSIWVAGMRVSTTYHMRAVIDFGDGMQFVDSDHTFTTGGLPSGDGLQFPEITVSRPSGSPFESGIEMLNLVATMRQQPQAVATDMAGNIIWWYTYQSGTHPPEPAEIIQPIKGLPNGNLLLVISPSSSSTLTLPPPPSAVVVAREINLAGDTVREISISTLNSRLAAAGFNLAALTIHHDILPLPNGHWILLVNSTRTFTNLPGLPGTTTVAGDALVDLDANLQPTWVWNSFDHLDVNRHPMQFPDWTHANAVIYSQDDGNLLLSVRHQHWILKIDYRNGHGTGNVIWRLGAGGDFTLQGGTDPTDWFYAQHYLSFITSNTTGRFSLMLFDNGNTRIFPDGLVCGSSGAPSCYSTVPILEIDEAAKTAQILFRYTTRDWVTFGGSAQKLQNGDIEFDECAVGFTDPSRSAVFEISSGPEPQITWQMNIVGNFAYRALRMPSLYPGVQW